MIGVIREAKAFRIYVRAADGNLSAEGLGTWHHLSAGRHAWSDRAPRRAADVNWDRRRSSRTVFWADCLGYSRRS